MVLLSTYLPDPGQNVLFYHENYRKQSVSIEKQKVQNELTMFICISNVK